jgi:hypothetical protein
MIRESKSMIMKSKPKMDLDRLKNGMRCKVEKCLNTETDCRPHSNFFINNSEGNLQ